MRRALVSALVGLAAVLLVAGIVAVWADHLFLNPGNWETTSAKLLANPTVRTSTATYLADQVSERLDLSQLPGSDSVSATGLRGAIFDAVDAALGLHSVRALWAQANRATAAGVLAIVDGPPGPVSVSGDSLNINLGPILRTAVTDAHLPAVVTSAVPAEAGLTIVRSDQVRTVRTAGRALRDLARWLAIIVPVLWLVALALASGRRRRTLAWIGMTSAAAGALVLLARALLVTPVADAVSANLQLRPVIAATITTVTSSLAHLAAGVGLVGLAVAVVAVVAGLAALAGRGTWSRRSNRRPWPQP